VWNTHSAASKHILKGLSHQFKFGYKWYCWIDKIRRRTAHDGSSPIFAFSNYTTFSETQTGATVPFNEHANLNGSEARV
jgi:hypothetical protein